MKSLCQIIFWVVAGAFLVLGECDVESEVNRILNEISACYQHVYNETTQPFDFIRYYANFRLTNEEAKDKIIDYCNVFEHQYEDCLRSANSALNQVCSSDKTIKEIIEINDIGFQIDSYLCEGGAQRYLDFLETDGPDCYAKNDNHETCLDNYFDAHKDAEFSKCSAIGLALECVQAYEDCENLNVKIHFNDVNRQLQYLYGCEN